MILMMGSGILFSDDFSSNDTRWSGDTWAVVNGKLANTPKSNTTDGVIQGGFEIAGAGGDDVINYWAETKGSGTIARTTAAGEFHSGSAACKLTGGRAVVQTGAYMIPGHSYTLSYWWKGDGSNAGAYNVNDSSHGANIIGFTSIPPTSTHTPHTATFIAPAGCYYINIAYFAPGVADGYGCLDDVALVDNTTFEYSYLNSIRLSTAKVTVQVNVYGASASNPAGIIFYNDIGQTESGRLHVSGTSLVNGNGARFIAKGVNVEAWRSDDSEFHISSGQHAVRNTIASRMKALGINAVRLCYNRDYLEANSNALLANYLEMAVAFASAGIYVMPCEFKYELTTMTGYSDAFPTMKAIIDGITAAGYASYLIFNPFNEPGNSNIGAWVTMCNATLDYLRGTAKYTGVVVFDSLMAQSPDETNMAVVIAHDATLLPSANVVFSTHPYPVYPRASPTSALYGCAHASTTPFIFGESGITTDRKLINGYWPSYISDEVLHTGIPAGFNGLFPWIWSWVGGNTMVDHNVDYVTLTDTGQNWVDCFYKVPLNYWRVYHDGTNIKIDKCVYGAVTHVRSTATTYIDGAFLKVVIKGNNLDVYYSGSKVGNTENMSGSVTGLSCGLYSSGTTATFDNFSVSR